MIRLPLLVCQRITYLSLNRHNRTSQPNAPPDTEMTTRVNQIDRTLGTI
jgi:hypothetical protein